MAQHYKDLIAWQKAMDLVNAVYDATDSFPKREVYSLTDQIRRAVSQRRNYLPESQAAELLKRADEVRRILSGLIGSLREKTL